MLLTITCEIFEPNLSLFLTKSNVAFSVRENMTSKQVIISSNNSSKKLVTRGVVLRNSESQ
jgi:hypothetical protein